MAFWTRFLKSKSSLLEAQEKPVGFLKRAASFVVRQKPFWYATGLSLVIISAATYYAVRIRPYLGEQAGIPVDTHEIEAPEPKREVPKEVEPFPEIKQNVVESRTEAMALLKQAESQYQQGALDQARDALWTAVGLTADTGLLTIAYVNLANILQGEGKYDQAIQVLQRALSFDRHFVKGYYNLGVVHIALRNFDAAQIAFQVCLREDASFAPCNAGLGQVHATMGRHGAAIQAFTASLASAESPAVRYDLGLAYLHSENKTLALEQFTLAQKSADDPYLRYLTLFNRAYVLDQLSRHEEAVGDYQAALALAPKDVDATFNLGLCLMALGRKQEALDAFLRVISLDPENFDAYSNAATLHSALGQYQAAHDLILPVREKLPMHKQINYLLGNLFHRLNRLPDAHDAFNRVLYHRPEELSSQFQADALAAFASVMDDSGDLDAAERLYQDAILIDKNSSYLHFNLARTLRRHRKLEESVKEIAIASEMEHSGNYTYVLAMAEILLDAELLSKSFDAFRLAGDLSPDEIYPRFMMAHVAARQRQWSTALAEFNKLLAKNPPVDVRGAIHKGIGNVYHEQAEYDRALTAYRAAAADLPQDASLFYNIARTYMHMNKYDECYAALQKSLALNSETTEAHTLLGAYYFKKGLSAKAFASFDRAVKLNPENIEAYYNREALRKYQ